jgi:hypothetical protein
MVDHLFLPMPSSVALGIVEIYMQLARADMLQLLSMPVGQWENLVINEIQGVPEHFSMDSPIHRS